MDRRRPPPDEAVAKTARNRRRAAAASHQPKPIRLLLVAESPPEELDRYFYFDGPELDPLFEGVCEVLFEEKPDPGRASDYLKQLRRRGLFAIELRPDGTDLGAKQQDSVGWLVIRCEDLQAEHIVLVGTAVYRAAYPALAKADLPVVDVKVDFPSTDRQSEFRRQLRTALVKAGLENLIRPRARR